MTGNTGPIVCLVLSAVVTLLLLAIGAGVCSTPFILLALFCVAWLAGKHEIRQHRRVQASKRLQAAVIQPPDEAPPITSPGVNVIKLPVPRYE